MLFCVVNTLSLLTILVATSASAQQPLTEQFPHIPAMTHQKMTYNGQVIYEADVDQNAHYPKPFSLQVRVDSLSGNCAGIVGHVAVASSNKGTRVNKSSEYISCVVTESSSDGQAKVDIVYDFQNQEHNVHKSGHVKANLEVGREYETVNNGSRVALLLDTH